MIGIPQTSAGVRMVSKPGELEWHGRINPTKRLAEDTSAQKIAATISKRPRPAPRAG